MKLRIAHFSDLHFGIINKNPRQFLSKEWLGNANLIFIRKRAYSKNHFEDFSKLLKKLEVEALAITGDFASTSQEKEFEEAVLFLKSFSLPIFSVPGNHDCYSKDSEKIGRFYHYFPQKELQEQRVELISIGKKWWWLGLDCTLATKLFHSFGCFSDKMEERLLSLLKKIAEDEKVIVACHWPLGYFKGHRHDLQNQEKLKEILLSHPKVKLYLHGHNHVPTCKCEKGLWMIGGGSLAKKTIAPFYILDLSENELLIESYAREDRTWKMHGSKKITLR